MLNHRATESLPPENTQKIRRWAGKTHRQCVRGLRGACVSLSGSVSNGLRAVRGIVVLAVCVMRLFGAARRTAPTVCEPQLAKTKPPRPAGHTLRTACGIVYRARVRSVATLQARRLRTRRAGCAHFHTPIPPPKSSRRYPVARTPSARCGDMSAHPVACSGQSLIRSPMCVQHPFDICTVPAQLCIAMPHVP